MTDERFRKSAGEGRDSRAMKDRAVTENREISDDERVAMFRQQFFQSSLPAGSTPLLKQAIGLA